MFDDGARMVRVAGGLVTYYNSYTTTNLYVQISFGAGCNTVRVVNDSAAADVVSISWDGATLAGELKAGESADFNVSGKTSVYVKGAAGGGIARIWGW